MNFRICIFVFGLTLTLLAIFWRSHLWDKVVVSLDQSVAGYTLIGDSNSLKHRIFLENDSYYWLTFAREQKEQGTFRTRWTNWDNTPFGREVHWSQSVTWSLRCLAWLKERTTNLRGESALEAGAVWLNPLLYALFLLLTGVLIYRSFGLISGLVTIIGLGSLPDIFWCFHPLRPDHQGFHLLFSVLSLLAGILALLGGSKTPPNGKTFGFHSDCPLLILSGVTGGLGFWIGATPQLVTLGILFLIGCMSCLLDLVKKGRPGEFAVLNWRSWGIAGAITSLIFYLLEYFPHHLSWHLEVNHPLYSLLWLACGEFLHQLSAYKRNPLENTISWTVFGLCLTYILSMTFLLLWGPVSVHAMHDGSMYRFHSQIAEFRSVMSAGKGQSFGQILRLFGVFPLSLFIILVFLIPIKIPPRSRSVLMATWIATALAVFLALYQLRWIALAGSMMVLLMAITIGIFCTSSSRIPQVFFNILLLLAGIQWLWINTSELKVLRDLASLRTLDSQLAKGFMLKRMALSLGENLEGNEPRILADPDLSPYLIYYARIPCVVSYYWENQAGLSAALQFWTDKDGIMARKIVRERKLTHLLSSPTQNFDQIFVIKDGATSANAAKSMILTRICQDDIMDYPWVKRNSWLEFVLTRTYRLEQNSMQLDLEIFELMP